jgi:hypothetical protein
VHAKRQATQGSQLSSAQRTRDPSKLRALQNGLCDARATAVFRSVASSAPALRAMRSLKSVQSFHAIRHARALKRQFKQSKAREILSTQL